MEAKERFVCLTGGFGCGKSYGIALKMWDLARINAGFDGMLISRSATQVRKLCTEVESVLRALGANFRKKGFDEYHFDFDKDGKSIVYVGTTENGAYERWAGGNMAWVVIDEIDTMPRAEEVWKFANDRVRVKAPMLQTACASTPEGFGFLYNFFERQVTENPSLASDRRLIRGNTFDNPYLDPSYIRSQIQTRDPRSLKAYLYGEFVSLDGALVYYRFDKVANATTKTIADFPAHLPLHVGLDFNKNINAASINIIQDNCIFTVDELFGSTDTDQVIRNLDARYPNRPIKVYPDASGFEGIQQLRRRYGPQNVLVNAANPRVDLRVASVNMKLKNHNGAPTAFINPTKAPRLWEGLSRQPKKPDGSPNKELGLDHAVDGYGYLITRYWPNDGRTGELKLVGT